MSLRKSGLGSRFSVLIGLVLIGALLVFLAWSMHFNNRFAEDKALTEARMLNLSIMSAWDYLDVSQDAINYNSDGSYDFKHIYCAVAGKSIANRITQQSDGYVVKFVRENPRSATDAPDSFEREAITKLNDGGLSEYYRVTEYEGAPVLRYASRLEVGLNCLACHGEPAGTKDETGYLREGMKIGDIAGITSIVIPLDAYHEEAAHEAVRSTVFFVLLTAAVIVAIRLGLRRWVERPLEESNRRLSEANRAQSDFLATMSHELRTPLSSIIAFTDLWEKEFLGRSERERGMVSEVKQNSRLLLNMVNNTIDAAKVDAGLFEVHFEETDLVDVVENAVSVVDALSRKKGVVVRRAIPSDTPLVFTDPFALQKILVNLLSNAVRFSPSGGEVLIEVAQNAGMVEIKVVDFGCGIAPSEQERIFERFKQADGAQGGSGLGLYLSRSFAERLGGGIAVESQLGGGSVFTVSVPAGADRCCCGGDVRE